MGYLDVERTLTVSQVSLHNLPHFINIVPANVIGCIKTIGILNNTHLAENIPNFAALQNLPALEKVIIVPRGGTKMEEDMKKAMDAMLSLAGRNMEITRSPGVEKGEDDPSQEQEAL